MKAEEIFKSVTDELVRMIEQGIANPQGWKKPWAASAGHRNVVTQKPYQGFNQLILSLIALERGYQAPIWGTYKQWESLGFAPRGKNTSVDLIKWVEPRTARESGDDTGKSDEAGHSRRLIPVGFKVFNAAVVPDFTYIPVVRPQRERNRIAESVLRAARKDNLTIIEREGAGAAYSLSLDRVITAQIGDFVSADTYYETKFHEITHATAHPKRVGREFGARFGDQKYAVEELVAELGSSYLCAATGVEDRPNLHHAHYLANWLTVLKNDPRAIHFAASQAQTAATYWTSRSIDLKAEVETPSMRLF